MGRVVGIDLGTTNSAIAVVHSGRVVVITTSEGKKLPSVVAFAKNGAPVTGCAAKQQATVNAESTVFAVKRVLGRSYSDLQAANDHRYFSCRLRQGPHGDARIHVSAMSKDFTPQEIAAHILARLRQEAEAYLGEVVKDAVISVPAYFNETQRQAVKDAATIAGLAVRHIINEPTAVALSYGFVDRTRDETVMVVDLGGGTCDVSILDVRSGSVSVRASSGDTYLGGTDFDSIIADWIVNSFLRRHGIDLSRQRQAMQRIREAAEQAKIELSARDVTEIHLPFIATSVDGPRHLRLNLSRQQFEEMAAPLLERLRAPLRHVLADARMTPAQLDAVILVGGATSMPMVRRQIAEVTGMTPHTPADPDQAVVRGAALQAGALVGEIEEVRLQDVAPLSLGLETMGGMMSPIIPRNSSIPIRRSQVFSTVEDEQTQVEIHVLQGERPMAADNQTLGVFRLEGIPPAPRGIPQIEVTFSVDGNGMLHVSAQELTSGTSQTVTLAKTTSLSAAEVSKMVREAERCAARDLQRRNLVEARTAARQVLYQIERHLELQNGYIPLPLRRRLERQIRALQQAVEQEDARRIRRLTAAVQQASTTARPISSSL